MQKKTLLLTAVLAFNLTACGGGGGDTADATAPNTTAGSVTTGAGNNTACPANYRAITLNQSSISNATMSITAGNATFSIKVPATATPSIKICFGVATAPLADGGLHMLSDTYEVITYALDSQGATLANFVNPTVQISGSTSNVPAGVDTNSVAAKTDIYNNVNGALAASPKTNIAITGQTVVVSAVASKAGKYVVAYKP